MQTAVLYIRVSTDEQAQKGYSQKNQKERLEKFCTTSQIQILQTIYEDHSAKTFNRPEWSKLLLNINRSRSNRPDFILFTRWDRFSRNIADAYYMIGKLKNMNIETRAIDQPLNLDIPENKIMLAIYLATSEVENDRRSINVKQGIRKAKQEGRCTSLAPIGYINITLIDGKKCIIPHEPEATIIRNIFTELAKGGHSTHSIYVRAVENGLKCSLNNFWLLIRNPIYCGKIVVPACEKEKRHLVKGLHEALVTVQLFEKAQQVLNNFSKPQIRTGINKYLPLRGFLICPVCGRTLTGSASKGRKIYYHYYHCLDGCRFRVRADLLDGLLAEKIKQLVPLKFYVSLFETIARQVYARHFGEASNTQSHIFNTVEKSIERLTKGKQLLASGEIDYDDYLAIKADCEYKINSLGTGLNTTALTISKAETAVKVATKKFFNLFSAYEYFDTTSRRKMLNLLTEKHMTYDGVNLNLLVKNELKIVFDLKQSNQEEKLQQTYGDLDFGEDFTKEFEELIEYETRNNRNVTTVVARDTVLFLKNMAEIIFCV